MHSMKKLPYITGTVFDLMPSYFLMNVFLPQNTFNIQHFGFESLMETVVCLLMR